ncbi:hypothetical protein F511_21520 [Dorcoceras hygrometricum]|uniref:Uncharacterized protein n=1 Tax=Dorcoceras hygrometricum TaxID=472368 RepID=A0A2Z7C5A6_9LAMI|nr:hypothetical protein F511_21520 [Dorcoceras hygrometricum]
MGPISYIGPKTSRAARDRPEQNPRKNSAVTISPEHHWGAAATNKSRAAQGRSRPRQARRSHAPWCIDHGATNCAMACRPSAMMRTNRRNNCAISSSGVEQQQLAGPSCTQWLAHDSAHRPCNMRGQRAIARAHARINDSACKNQLVVVSVQYGPFNPYIPIRSTTIGRSRFAKDPIAMHTSWRSNHDIASVTSIGYPRMSASGESSTTMHRLLHASGSHPIPPPCDPKPSTSRLPLHFHLTTAARRPPPAAVLFLRGWTCFDHVDEEVPFVTNSSALLVQTDEGGVIPVEDRIRRSTAAYR